MMPRLTRLWLTLPAVVIVVAALVLAARPMLGNPADQDVYAGHPDLAAERDAIGTQLEFVSNRISQKEELIDALIAGDMTLEEVTDEFLRLNEEEPAVVEVIRSRYRGSGDEEKTARNVLEYVRIKLPAGEAGERVAGRLDRQFQARFGNSADLLE